MNSTGTHGVDSPTRPSEANLALIRRHRQACLAFATCEAKDHDAAATELMAATEALEEALTNGVAVTSPTEQQGGDSDGN